ncbi:MAG: transglutaminase family protein [Pirellulaceae bacterium]|nr:transglutaminase family protein [Pirellulaceae bacterium]
MTYFPKILVQSTLNRIRERTRRRNLQRKYLRRYLQPGLEGLEPRQMLASDLPDVITVGRVLSTWTTADIQNHELKITYSVYNQQASEVSGVLLTTTLEPGVTFKTATQLPDQNGQELAWSLGTLPAFGRASIEVSVSLVDATPLQIDTGAHAFGTVDAAAVTDAAPFATLRTDVIDPLLLASTPDANTTDPFIQAKAAELDYDPQRIFDFLTHDIGYESYVGSLRGARGTLWSNAGNALDEASLGIALMRSSGIPSQYVQGTLSDPLAQQLILSMFPASFQTVGYIPAGTQTADPAHDPLLLTETKQHYWIQFNAGAGFKDADPTFPDAVVGQTFAPSQAVFAEVSAALRQHVTLTVNVETYSQAGALFGLGNALGQTTVLTETFNSVELVGRPLAIGHLVTGNSLGTPVFSSQTYTYTPYFRIGDEAFDLKNDSINVGQSFQELFTNFPFGTTVVTGEFLNTLITATDGSQVSAERTLFDRIGYAARQGQVATNVSIGSLGTPSISPLDLHTISFQSGINQVVVQ